MVKIITDYGFCYGVERAIHLMQEAGKKHVPVYLTHPLIHNLPENEKLMNEAGASFVTDDTKVSPESIIVFSAHGHTLEEEKRFSELATCLDATCPLIEARYKMLSSPKAGTTYLFLGKKSHQETLGFLSHFPFLVLIDSEADVLSQLEHTPLEKHTVLMPQTTISEATRKKAEDYLKAHTDLVLSVPICPQYSKRAAQAISTLASCDPKKSYFIVVGDRASSNAKEILSAVLSEYPGLQGQIALNLQDIDKNAAEKKDIYLASATSAGKECVEALLNALCADNSL